VGVDAVEQLGQRRAVELALEDHHGKLACSTALVPRLANFMRNGQRRRKYGLPL